MTRIHEMSVETAERYSEADNYVDGANIAGFIKVAQSMIDQGYV
jgi:glutamate dehydrogenase (NADP+)